MQMRFFFADWLIYLTAFITCCHPIVTVKSRLGLEEQPRILDHVTVLTVTITTNLSFITPSSNNNGLIFPISLSLVLFSLHCIAFHFISCTVLLYCTVYYSLLSLLICSLLTTSSVNLNLNLNLIWSSREAPTESTLVARKDDRKGVSAAGVNNSMADKHLV